MKEARQKKDILHDFMYVKFQKIPLYSDRKVSGCRGGGLLGVRCERRERREGLLRGKKKLLVMMDVFITLVVIMLSKPIKLYTLYMFSLLCIIYT